MTETILLFLSLAMLLSGIQTFDGVGAKWPSKTALVVMVSLSTVLIALFATADY